MKFITAVGVIFYTIVFFIVGGLLITFALDWLNVQDVYKVIEYMQLSTNSRIITGAIGLVLIIINFSLAQMIFGRMEKERTIAFNTPTGQVTIALSAVEDLIKRLAQKFLDIKDMRPSVIANKKGVQISLRLVLQSEVNIPDLTGQLQEMIKTKIQEMLGIEEQIIVKVHVAKIITREEKKKEEPTTGGAIPPFGGYPGR